MTEPESILEKVPPRSTERVVSTRRLTRVERGLCVGAALGLLMVFGVARLLTPDPHGHGTHTHLGLPPCGMMQYFGVPCPFCGMTTAFALIAHGRIAAGIATQPAGALIFALCIVAVPLLLFAGARGRGIALPRPSVQKWIMVISASILLAAWLYKLADCAKAF